MTEDPAHHQPVGEEGDQHFEMAQDMAGSFHAAYGKVFVRPEPMIPKSENLARG